MKYKLYYFIFIMLIFNVLGCGTGEVTLKQGMKIKQSVKIKPGIYRINADDDEPIITITRSYVEVDFTGVTLIGSNDKALPSEFYGTAVFLKKVNGVKIKNLTVKGFHLGVYAEDCKQLVIKNSDFSYNYRQRLGSNREREDISDHLDYRENENDEWAKYGAGIYLKECHEVQVHDCKATNGQNGLLLNKCTNSTFFNNNFSFNSGVGIGLYNSTRNRLMHNKLDWNVRGYSHGIYRQNHDASGILVYEESNENTFAYNSATHCGEGLFLWGGEETITKGKGGCNDNLIYENDFSHATTSGIEITFSSNKVIHNIIEDCHHGIWAGYSHNTLISGNSFEGNDKCITIEHGHDFNIEHNHFRDAKTGIKLWEQKEPPAWGLIEQRNTASKKYKITNNQFFRLHQALDIHDTREVEIVNNHFENIWQLLYAERPNQDFRFADNNIFRADSLERPLHADVKKLQNHWEGIFQNLDNQSDNIYETGVDSVNITQHAPVPWPEALSHILPDYHPRGRQFILMNEWGPYDFLSPTIWLRDESETGLLKFEVLGREGNWKIKNIQGVGNLSKTEGKIPDTFTAQATPVDLTDILIEAEYIGKEVVTPFGEKISAGTPYVFKFRDFEKPLFWKIKWYKFEHESRPDRHLDKFEEILANKPLKITESSHLQFNWRENPISGVPEDDFALIAETEAEFPDNEYDITITSDEGVQIFIDGKEFISDFEPHEPRKKGKSIRLSGKHKIKIIYYDLSEFGTLLFGIKPKNHLIY